MNLVVVEDSYLNVKYKSGYSWLVGDDKESPQAEVDQPQPPAVAPSNRFNGGDGGGPP